MRCKPSLVSAFFRPVSILALRDLHCEGVQYLKSDIRVSDIREPGTSASSHPAALVFAFFTVLCTKVWSFLKRGVMYTRLLQKFKAHLLLKYYAIVV